MDELKPQKSTNKIAELLKYVTGLIFHLLKKWWIIALAGILGGVLGITIAFLQRPKYQSHLTFALEEGEGGLGGAISLAAEFGFSFGSSGKLFDGDNILTLMTSRRIVERTLLSVDTLAGEPISMADYFQKISADSTKKPSNKKPTPQQIRLSKISFPAGQPKSSFSYLQDSVLKNLYQDFTQGGALVVSRPDKKLNLYEVSFTSPDERFTKLFTDKLIENTKDFYVELKTRKSKETLDILQLRVDQTKGLVNSSIRSRANIEDANINPAFQQANAQLQEKQVDISAYGGAYAELYKNLEVARFQYLKAKPLLQIIDPADYPMKRIKKGKLITGIIFSLIFGFVTLVVLISAFVIKKEMKKYNEQILDAHAV